MYKIIIINSKIDIKGKENIVEIQDGNLKRVKIAINGDNNSIIIDKNTHIRENSIIGINSLVTSNKFPANVIKKNIDWSRKCTL